MKIFQKIFITTFFFIVISSNSNVSCKNNDNNLNNQLQEKKYSQILENLKNDYVIDIKRFQSYSQMGEVIDALALKEIKKSYKDYQVDSANYFQAIIDIYKSDFGIIKYFYKFRSDSSYGKLTLEFFDKNNSIYNSKTTRKGMTDGIYYCRVNNITLTLILNYYLNTEQNIIKLLIDAVYVTDNSIKAEEMYKKLDKIFEKYGYEDKEKIRKAILDDFGKCIDYTQL